MNKTPIVLLFLFSTLYSYSQFKSGFIIGGGKGSISDVVLKDEDLSWLSNANMQQNYKYKFDVTIGYKFRIAPQNRPFFYDLDLYFGLRRFNTGYIITGEFINDFNELIIVNQTYHKQHIYHSFSLNPSWNYRLVKGLYAGAGIEPTVYCIWGNNSVYFFRLKFDLPLTAKVGYDLKFIDFSISYKHGFFDTMDYSYLKPAKFRNLQLSIFIPFGRYM
jgi:hypothetical protein